MRGGREQETAQEGRGQKPWQLAGPTVACIAEGFVIAEQV